MSTAFMRAYAAATAAGVPVLITGHPGEAKTAKLSAVLDAWGRHTEVVIGSLRESSDFLGLPLERMTGGEPEVFYAPPGWANRLAAASASTLILDEFNLARESVMAAMQRIVEEGYIGEVRLPATATVTAIMNPVESSTYGVDLTPPIANRFCHLDWHFDADEWLSNVTTDFAHVTYPPLEALLTREDRDVALARAGAWVTGFLRERRDALNPGPPEDPAAASGAWASPRTWTKLFSVLSYLRPGDMEGIRLAAFGLIGKRWATEFLAWVKSSDLANPHAVIADPDSFDWTQKRADRIYAVLTSVATVGAQAASSPDPDGRKLWRKALLVCAHAAEAGRTDIGIPAVRTLWAARPAGTNRLPKRVSDAFSDLFHATGKVSRAGD